VTSYGVVWLMWGSVGVNFDCTDCTVHVGAGRRAGAPKPLRDCFSDHRSNAVGGKEGGRLTDVTRAGCWTVDHGTSKVFHGLSRAHWNHKMEIREARGSCGCQSAESGVLPSVPS